MVDGISAHPFTTSHDCADPSAFVFESDGSKAGVMTDTGVATQLARQLLKGLDYLVLESNHDYNMLMAGPYPWHLKKRIASRQGHLSNSDCAGLLSQVAHPGLQGVTLAHLSETNNNPDLALLEARNALGPNAAIQAAVQHEPMGVISVE